MILIIRNNKSRESQYSYKTQDSHSFPFKGMENKVKKGLTKSNSTKGERRIAEILKNHKIKFLFKARIGRYEVDFLIGHLALEIDGKKHLANPRKDIYLASKGYVPVHLSSYFKSIENELLYFIRVNSPNR